MIKKVTVLSLCLCLLILGSSNVFANEIAEVEKESLGGSEITPYMNYISRASCSLYIDSNGKSTTNCSVYGYQGITTKVSITSNLQQYKGGRWVTIETFKESSNSHRTSLYEPMTITKGYSYRVSTQVKAYSGSKVETRNLTSSIVKY